MFEKEFSNDDWTSMTSRIRKSVDGIHAVDIFCDTPPTNSLLT